jgi:hypothetical protein
VGVSRRRSAGIRPTGYEQLTLFSAVRSLRPDRSIDLRDTAGKFKLDLAYESGYIDRDAERKKGKERKATLNTPRGHNKLTQSQLWAQDGQAHG